MRLRDRRKSEIYATTVLFPVAEPGRIRTIATTELLGGAGVVGYRLGRSAAVPDYRRGALLRCRAGTWVGSGLAYHHSTQA